MSPLDNFNVPQIQFLGEQDGVPERQLKTKFINLFKKNDKIKTAFLAIVSYDDAKTYSIALCLDVPTGADEEIAKQIWKIFSSMFGTHEHLDIVFVSTHQVQQLLNVCKPFYFHKAEIR
ncbi:MAG: enhanced serine sensitivity protein SseB C-terminal domain-containing protein [Chloroflexi bacterium]|nr:enhanced serine sensitivity protein SseB C-terminal domain-containing protein [Chloroflexota bacterium]